MAGKRDEVTIAEVAEALDISKTTVSRAISGKGRVSEATRARVFDYIGKGRQDAAAPLRTAQQGPTNNLALVIPKHFMRLDLPFLRKCMGGVWNMAAQRGYDLLLCYAGETDVGQLERQLESYKVDGVILSRTMLHDECVQTLQRHNVPFVAIGRVDDDKVPQVDNDQVGASAEMTRLLLQLGMRRIAYMGGCTDYTVNADRLRGSLPKADAAMIFDWDNRWALDDAWGMQIKQKNLRETCCQLYAQLNHCGVETDVVGVDADLNRYKLVVLPMLFMTKPGFAQKIREYVENGGTVVATYLLGYVDESTLCWLGGFPGDGLREVFGVTASELDTLYPGEGNRAIWVKSSQQSSIKDYCELLQPAEGTEVVAVYGQDFYSGHAAVTHHVFGKGHAYYIGARLDDAGNAAVLRAALADAKVHLRDLPQGVEYHCRESENARYHFYINTTQSAVKVQVESGADLLSGKNVLGSMELKPYDACAIEEKVK